MNRKICVITGSRAEYGLLRWVMQGIKDEPSLTLQIIATGMHLSPQFGNTYQEIEGDGFAIDRKVEMLTGSDTPVGVAKSMGKGINGIADALNELKPDVALVLGDRFEVMAAAQVLVVLQIPIIHLCGGDVGSGTYDNIFRDCISLMSNLHCVTHEDAKQRVKELGVSEEYIHNVGATCVDGIQKLDLLTLSELCKQTGIEIHGKIIVVTYHPLTRGAPNSSRELIELLMALEIFSTKTDVTIVFTGTNADNGGRELSSLIIQYVESHDNCYFFQSLGHLRYLSLVKHALMVVGNSSSGIYEAPYLGTSTIDVGIRQLGRLAPTSVARCDARTDEILAKMNSILSNGFPLTQMVYGDGTASMRIVELIMGFVGNSLSGMGTDVH